jgi:eukaryotic-like serine/threonine-protein kinase
VITTVVLVSQSRGEDQNPAAPPASTQPQPTTPARANLKQYQELGVEVGIPPDWRREPSAPGAVSHVVWEGARGDPKDGVLTVRVLRDTTAPNASPLAYLTDESNAQRDNRDNTDFRQLGLTDGGATADLEYTHGSAGSTWFHTWIRATAKEKTIYTLTFSLYAGDSRTLGSRWQAVQPLIAQIRESFRLAG